MSRHSLAHKLRKDLLDTIDREILVDLTIAQEPIPTPDDVLGILIYGIHEELMSRLPRDMIPQRHQHTIEVNGLTISAQYDCIEITYSSTGGLVRHLLKRYEYNNPDLLPQLVLYVKKRLRVIRKIRREKHNGNTH